jgi:serine/threonine protein phosphatase PrpC
MLYCPNYTCQTANPETHKFCQKCRTPLPKHYLWAVGDSVTAYQPDDLLVNRYLCKSPRIFLDTKPGLYPTVPTEIPQEFISYLRLSPHRLHVPQIYDIVPSAVSPTAKIALLDEAAFTLPTAVYRDSPGSPAAAPGPQLLPALTDAWSQAPALRQLNWLWQIAQLWHSFSLERVVSTLLSPELIRTEGALLRILELRVDGAEIMTFPQLGQLWLQWLPTAHADIAPGLSALCQQLNQNEFRNSEQLLEQLDQLLLAVGRSQARQVQIATRTDQGPSRQRNEDACFPPSGTVKTKTMRTAQASAPNDNTLVVVCDGIGGHQGGDVASNLAIEAVRQQVQSLHPEQTDPTSLMVALEQAVCVANDQISQRNDNEQRFDRQRMGTTLVMALMRAHELYITHVGDSRAYWITRRGCHQVTLDDDVASREVRLGYSPYREALQQPSAGSLVQALGMGASSILHPTVQRFVLDEDSVFLLCSDGLSDNDRVEEYWETILLPLLEGKTDVNTVAQQLVDIANTRNGHDNVTVGLLYVRMTDPRPTSMAQSTKSNQVDSALIPTFIQHDRDTEIQTRLQSGTGAAEIDTAKTKVLPAKLRKPSGNLRLLGLIVLLLGGGGLLAYSLSLSFRSWVDGLLGFTPPLGPDPAPTLTLPSPVASPLPSLQPGSFIQLNVTSTTAFPVLPTPPSAESSLGQSGGSSNIPTAGGNIAPGSVLQVLKKQAAAPQELWIQVQVCSVMPGSSAGLQGASPPLEQSANGQPAGAVNAAPNAVSPAATSLPPTSSPDGSVVPNAPPLPPGATGWVQESAILPLVLPIAEVSLEQRGVCNEFAPPQVGEPSSPLPGTSIPPASVDPTPGVPTPGESGVS